MIAVLLLIPIIVLLTISVSGMIISAEVAIGIESMRLLNKGEVVETVTVMLEDYKPTNKPYQLIVDYYPKLAQDKTMEWISSDPTVATVSDKGVIYFVGYGSTVITAVSKANVNKKASCTFFVLGKSISEVKVTGYGDSAGDELELKRYESLPLNVTVIPGSALGDGKVSFSSSDNSVATVDANGVVYGVKEGFSIISVTAQGIKGNPVTGNVLVTVSGEKLTTSGVFYTEDGSLDFASHFSATGEGATVVGEAGVTVSGTLINLGVKPEAVITVTKNGVTEKVIVRRAPGNSLLINNVDSLLSGIWQDGYFVPVGGGNVKLSVISASGALPAGTAVRWRSSDETVLKVEDGRLFGKGSGTATITASADGYFDAVLDIKVASPVDYLTLDLDNSDDAVGLKEERVFGIYTYDGESITTNLPIIVKATAPSDADSEFYYYSDNEEYATVDASGIITFYLAGVGHEVTITVKAKYSNTEAKDSYTFKLVDGINFGLYYGNDDGTYSEYGDNIYDDKANIMPSFQPYYDFKYLMNDYRSDFEQTGDASSVIFHTNVYMPAEENFHDNVLFFRSIYGNGFKYDGQFHTEYHQKFDTSMFAHSHPYDLGRTADEIFIENLAIQSSSPVSEDSMETFDNLTLGGTPIRFYVGDSTHKVGGRVRYSYCLFQYGYCCMSYAGGTYYVEGCIFRNVAGTCIIIQGCPNVSQDVTLKNSIFSNIIGCALMGSNGDFPVTDPNSTTRYITLRFEGDNYIYNWKNLNEIRMDIVPSGIGIDDSIKNQINDYIAKLMSEALTKDVNSDFVVTGVNTHSYFNFGFTLLGMWRPLNIEYEPTRADFEYGVNVYGEKVKVFEINYQNSKSLNPLLKAAIKGMYIDLDDAEKQSALVLPVDDKGEFNTKQAETYNIDKTTLARLKGIKTAEK